MPAAPSRCFRVVPARWTRCWPRRTVRCGCCLATPPPAGQTRPAPKNCPLRCPTRKSHAAGLMRVNHVGEVCAQALYRGQASVCREPAARALLLEAAAEEVDHLVWCNQRLSELGSRPSLLNPVWYAGSFALGVVASYAGVPRNLGFMAETERQVEAHRWPPADLAAAGRALAPDRAQDEGRRGASPRQRGSRWRRAAARARARRHARHVQDHDDDGVLDLSGIRIAAMRGGNRTAFVAVRKNAAQWCLGTDLVQNSIGDYPKCIRVCPKGVNPLSKTRRLGKSLIHAGLRSARPNLAANSQRPTLTIPGLKIILASHKRSVLCISSDVETQTARCKPRMPSRAKAAPNMPRLSPPPSSFGGFSPRSHDLRLYFREIRP